MNCRHTTIDTPSLRTATKSRDHESLTYRGLIARSDTHHPLKFLWIEFVIG